MYVQEPPLWMKGLKLPAWLSFVCFITALVIFFCAFFGHSWYVTPNECQEPTRRTQQSLSRTCYLNFGIFRLCHRGECRYSLDVDYMVVGQIFYLEIQQAYEKFLIPVRVLEVIAFVCMHVTFAAFLIFLGAFDFSHVFGLITAGLQVLTGILIIIGCSLFGNTFRGPTDALPYGWSFWLAIVSACIFLINGVFIAFIGMAALLKHSRLSGKPSSLGQRFSFMNT